MYNKMQILSRILFVTIIRMQNLRLKRINSEKLVDLLSLKYADMHPGKHILVWGLKCTICTKS